MLCISVCLLPLCMAVPRRTELGCSWWDCIDGTCLFLQTLLCASPICAHPEASADKPTITQGDAKWKDTPHSFLLFPFSPLPALLAAEARHICHTCGLLPFCAVCGEMCLGLELWDNALLGERCTRVGWCLAESRPALSHLPSPPGPQDSSSYFPPHHLPSVSLSLT